MKDDAKPASLTALERESIEYFISFVQLLGMPKSVGEIYGLLFVAGEPMPMDGVVSRLQISKGSASGGLALLRELGVVQRVYVEGDRRDHYDTDLNVARFVDVFFRQRLQPRLENGAQRLERMESFAEAEVDSEKTEEAQEQELRTLGRIQALRTWQNRGQRLLPFILRFLKK
jgi:DNA-binding transcriptional regulator GbsR (MarR family)